MAATHHMKSTSASILSVILSAAWLTSAAPVRAVPLIFNSLEPSSNEATRAAWLAALGISTSDYLIDFETGFAQGQDIGGLVLPGGLILDDSPLSSAPFGIIVTGKPAEIGTSNPVGWLTATHNNDFVRFDFSTNPVDYVGFLDIDQSSFAIDVWTGLAKDSQVTFHDDAIYVILPSETDTTFSNGNSAEFWGVIGGTSGAIKYIDIATSGDATWGIDNIEFGWLNLGGSTSLTTLTTGGDIGGTSTAVPDQASTGMLLLGVLVMATFARRVRGSNRS
jgi:hypothetical protein